jgi:alcohol dehydrogenase
MIFTAKEHGSRMTSPFTFHLPTKIEVGEGLIHSTGKLIKTVIHGKKRALVVTDAGVRRVGLADFVFRSLRNEGFECEWHDTVEPNPKDTDCETGGIKAKQFAADVIVAVGGGSVIDSAKAIALLQTHEGRLQDYEGRGRVIHPVTPIIAIPTTAGTGSEVTRSTVITDIKRKFKMTIKDVKLAPSLAIVDPQTTYALPPAITASTGMDAFVHAIEAYTCRLANPISDAMAVSAMEFIFRSLKTAVHDGSNKQARTDMMIGSLLAGIAFSHADVAAVHCMAEALGGMYDTPHGVANSIFLPIVTAYNVPANPARHAKAAEICGLPVQGLSDDAAASLLVKELSNLSREIGIPSLRELDYVNTSDFAALADAAFRNGSTPSNCREIGANDYLALFQQSYGVMQ